MMAVITEANDSDISDTGEKLITDGERDEMISEESEANLDENEEMNFTKPTPKDMLPNKIKRFHLPKIASRYKQGNRTECGSCEESSDDADGVDTQENSPQRRKKPKKSERKSLTNQKIIAFVVIFPMLSTGVYMIYEMLGRFKFEKSMQQLTATVGGALIAIIIMSQVAVLRSALKFVLCFAWIVFLIPTYQVYTCSPIELKNDMLGTWFKLQTPAEKFLQDSYIASTCFRSSKCPTPYFLSLMSPKITLKANIVDLINLNMENEIPNDNDDDVVSRSLGYFLLVSKRSVNKKFNKIYLILEAPKKLAEKLERSLKLTSEEKDKYLLLITGSVYNLDESLGPMKKELENMNYFVRPLKFKVQNVQYSDRYVKLKNNVYEQ